MSAPSRSPAGAALATVAGAPRGLLAFAVLAVSVGAPETLDSGAQTPVHEQQAGALDGALIESFSATCGRPWRSMLGPEALGVAGAVVGARQTRLRVRLRATVLQACLRSCLAGPDAPARTRGRGCPLGQLDEALAQAGDEIARRAEAHASAVERHRFEAEPQRALDGVETEAEVSSVTRIALDRAVAGTRAQLRPGGSPAARTGRPPTVSSVTPLDASRGLRGR